jgi:hypothetical protein
MMVAQRMVFGQNGGMTFLSITAAALLLLSSDPVLSGPLSGDEGSAVTPNSAASAATPAPASSSAEEDPIAAAASGLVAQIEDDNNPGGDLRLVSMKTTGCTTIITASGISDPQDGISAEVDGMAKAAEVPAATDPGAAVPAQGRTWTIDWAVPGSLSPADTFIFIEVAPVKIAIVGDASKPDQAAKLSALFAAMFETQLDCSTQF